MQDFDIDSFRSIQLPTELDIMSVWEKTDNTMPLVSIVCIAYNHEKYIDDCIRGFLLQKTSYPFEIIIHNDASTDDTNKIISYYAKRYPQLIKTINQTENQYSKSPNSVITIPTSLARGKYIALCEGDDFWIDSKKLDKQIKLLLTDKEVKLCFSAALIMFNSGKLTEGYKYSSNIKVFSTEEVIRQGGGFMPTCSLVIHKSVFKSLPNWFVDLAPVADTFLQILGSIDKGAVYLPDMTSIYRVESEGSWSSNDEVRKNNEVMAHKNRMIKCLDFINKQTNKAYDSAFKHYIAASYYSTALRYVRFGDYCRAKQYLLLSWQSKKNINIKQSLLKKALIPLPLLRFYLLFRTRNNK